VGSPGLEQGRPVPSRPGPEPGCHGRTGLIRVGSGPSRPGPVPGLDGPGGSLCEASRAEP
jgi:hypothetical protein